jgi:hypothetical protein
MGEFSKVINPSDSKTSIFWTQFYELGNWDQIDPGHKADLLSIADTINDTSFPGGLLPFPIDKSTTHYYATTYTGQEWRILQPWLLSFAGPTLSSFVGQPHTLDPSIRHEALLSSNNFYAVALLKPGNETDTFLRRSLYQLCETVKRRPESSQIFGVPRHLLLRHLFDSISAGDLESSFDHLSTLRDGLHLDTANLAFLEVHIRGAFQDWKGIVEMRDFHTLLHHRKPSVVTNALYESLYHVYLRDLVESGDIEKAVQIYIQEVRSTLGGGLSSFPSTCKSNHLARLYALDTISRESLEDSWYEYLTQYDLGALEESFNQKAFPEPSPTTNNIPDSTHDLSTIYAMLIEAVSLNTLESKRKVIQKIEQLSENKFNILMSSPVIEQLWEGLIDQVGEDPPNNWSSWLIRLDDPNFRDKASKVAFAGLDEWSYENAFDDADNFADRLRQLSTSDADTSLRESLPHLVFWLNSDPDGPRTEWLQIYLAIIDVYSLSIDISGVSRDATIPMIDSALSCELGQEDYRLLLEQSLELIGEDPGVHTAWWPLKVSEIFRFYSSPDVEARLRFFNNILNKLRPSLSLLTESQRFAAKELAEFSEWPWPETADNITLETGRTFNEILSNKTIAIYSLVESAGERAKVILEKLAPTCRIDILNDHVASPRLNTLSQNADIFIMVTGAAKHAATNAIRAARPKEKTLLMPMGKGSSSILEILDRWAKNLDTS